jgi:hypothetical protein
MSDHERAELTVADLLAKAAREEWPTSALSVRSHELGLAGDDTPTGPISMVRPYLRKTPMPTRSRADSGDRIPAAPPSPPWE